MQCLAALFLYSVPMVTPVHQLPKAPTMGTPATELENGWVAWFSFYIMCH